MEQDNLTTRTSNSTVESITTNSSIDEEKLNPSSNEEKLSPSSGEEKLNSSSSKEKLSPSSSEEKLNSSSEEKKTSNTLSSKPTSTTTGNRWVRSILFFLIFFFILFFYSNIFIAAVFATLLNLLSVSVFDNIASAIFNFSEKIIKFCFTPVIWIGRYLFKMHLLPFSAWLTSLRDGWFARHSRLVTIMLTLIITVIMLASTILRPVFATGAGNINDYFCLKTQFPWPICTSGLGVSSLPNGVRIGLIKDNSYGPFDQSTYNQDEQKVEGLIFKENQQACTGQHMTLVLVTMLSRTVENPLNSATLGVEQLQGSYLSQQSYNGAHPALPLCFAIANLGTSDTANKNSLLVNTCPGCYSMPQVAHQIAQFAHTDGSVRGIVGFPFSQQVKEALQMIKDNEQSLAALPIISPSASSDNFSSIPNFYRANSPDQNQAAAIAQFFCSHLVQNQSSPSIAMLTDPADYYSGDLAIDFENNIKCLNPTNQHAPIPYHNYDRTSIQNAVDTALLQDHASYIFFPGYDQDIDIVEAEIYKDVPNNASSITIIGGDGINNVNSNTHYSYTPVYSVNFAKPLPKTDSFVQNFIKAGFANAYGSQTPAIDPADLWMPTDTFLNYDAVQAMTQAVTQTVQVLHSTNFTQNDFNTTLQTINFQGETGTVTFQGNRVNSGHESDRTEQSAYITCYDTQHILHLVDSYIANTDNSAAEEDSSIPNITSCT